MAFTARLTAISGRVSRRRFPCIADRADGEDATPSAWSILLRQAIRPRAITDPQGVASVTVTPTHNFHFQWRYAGSGVYGPSHSVRAFRPVATKVRAHISSKVVSVGQRVVVRGSTHPVKSGFYVSLWRGKTNRGDTGIAYPKSPTRLVTVKTRADGTFRLVFHFKATGKRLLFVKVQRGDGNVAGYSHYMLVTIG